MKTAVLIAMSVGVVLTGTTGALGQIVALSESVEYFCPSETYVFEIEFNMVPDFYTLDDADRPEHSFQHEISYDWPYSYTTFNVLTRGSEIHIDGDVRIRDREGPSDPDSGGWGPIRGSVPYELEGTTIRFSVPASMIGDTDGHIYYRLIVCTYGAAYFSCTSESTIAEPCDPTPVSRGTWSRVKALYR